jgi:phosphoribosylamine-glycine ligase
MCAPGYPGSAEKGSDHHVAKANDLPDGVTIYHAGTAQRSGR